MYNSRKSITFLIGGCILLALFGSIALIWQKSVNIQAPSGKAFFDYDTIDAYHLDYDDTEVNRKNLYSGSSNQDKIKTKLLFTNDFPKDLADTKWVDELPSLGYSGRTLPLSTFPQIDAIFQEKPMKNPLFSNCMVVHRDILVFKKHSQIVGIAKICFACNQHHIVGARGNTKNFGQDGDYERLRHALKMTK